MIARVLSGFLIGATSLGTYAAVTGGAAEWIDRPWEYRYLLNVETPRAWEFARETYARDLKKNPKDATVSGRRILIHFDPQWVLVPAASDDLRYKRLPSLNVLRLDAKKDAVILQSPLRGDQLMGRLNRREDIVLTPSETKPEYIVTFGEFFMGAPEASDPRYSPAICSIFHGDTVPPSVSGRYASDTEATWTPDGFFGCREWAAQLYDSDRPYIDVTSYEMEEDYDAEPDKNGKHPLKPTTYIKPFIGFARFSDPEKPVIGKYGDQWYCITDCPKGDKPGQIDDIRAWAARSGWRVPVPPKNPREFVNRAAGAEEPVDD